MHSRSADLGSVDPLAAREAPSEVTGPPSIAGSTSAGALQPASLPPSKAGSLKDQPLASALSPRSSRGLPDLGSPLNPSSPKAMKPSASGRSMSHKAKRNAVPLKNPCCQSRSSPPSVLQVGFLDQQARESFSANKTSKPLQQAVLTELDACSLAAGPGNGAVSPRWPLPQEARHVEALSASTFPGKQSHALLRL